MTETQAQDQKDLAEASGNSPPAAHAQSHKRHDIAEGFKSRTKGEGLFNRFTYTGVGYFGVTGFSVFLTWLIRDSKWISQHYERFTKGLVQGMERTPFLKRFSGFIYSNMTILTLFTGGTIISVLPVKWLEDHKSKIVQRFDRWIYGKEKVENDPDIKKAHAEMEAVPQQTWWSVIGSRLLAFGTTLGISLLMGSEKSPVSKWTGHSIDSVSTRLGRGFDRFLHEEDVAVNRAIDNARAANKQWFPKQPVLMREDPASGITQGHGADRIPTRVFSYLALDGFYTIFTSIALYVSTRILAPFLGKNAVNNNEPATRAKPAAEASADQTPDDKQTPPSKIPVNTISSIAGAERMQAANSAALGTPA